MGDIENLKVLIRGGVALAFDRLRAEALPGSASRDLILGVANETMDDIEKRWRKSSRRPRRPHTQGSRGDSGVSTVPPDQANSVRLESQCGGA
jgi:hypothetical protein